MKCADRSLVVVIAIVGLSACGEEAIEQIENQPPVAVAQAATTASAGTLVTFNASTSSDADGTIADFAWDFGDDVAGSGALAQHIYNLAGTFTATLTVTDDDGATDTASVEIVVDSNTAPLAVIVAESTGAIAQSKRFDGASSSDADGQVVSFSWDFGDSSTATGPLVDHSYAAAGVFVVTLVVTDDKGASGNALHTITVDAAAPSVNGEWRWFLTDESLRDLGLFCGGSFQDSQLTILAGAPNISITEHAGGTSVPYSGSLTGDDFDVQNVQFGFSQEIVGTFTSPTEFSGFYKIDLGGDCADRPVSGVKQ